MWLSLLVLRLWSIIPVPSDRWEKSSIWHGENWQGKDEWLVNTWPISILSTTNPTWADVELNFGHCDTKLVSNCLSFSCPLRESIHSTFGMNRIKEKSGLNLLALLLACISHSLILKITVAEAVYFSETSVSFYARLMMSHPKR